MYQQILLCIRRCKIAFTAKANNIWKIHFITLFIVLWWKTSQIVVNQQVTTCQHMLLCSQRSKITVTSTAVNIKFDICYISNNPLNFVNDSGGIVRYQFQTHPQIIKYWNWDKMHKLSAEDNRTCTHFVCETKMFLIV